MPISERSKGPRATSKKCKNRLKGLDAWRPIREVPHGHWKTLTFLAGLRSDSIVAPFVLDGPINGTAFTAWVQQSLVPTLKDGDIVILDNLGSTKENQPETRSAMSAHISFSCRHTVQTSIPSR